MVLGIFIFCFPGRYMLSYWLRRKKNYHIIQKETLFCVSALCLVIQMLHSFQLFISLSYNLKKGLSFIHFLSVRECSWVFKNLAIWFCSVRAHRMYMDSEISPFSFSLEVHSNPVALAVSLDLKKQIASAVNYFSP